MKPLISVAELSALSDSNLVLVDCRHQLADTAWGRESYRAGHIPGAAFLHLDDDLSGPKTGRNGRHPLPDAQTLADTLGRLGIHRGSHVVAYDDPAVSSPGAARLWWLLGWLGFDNVQVLDGGFPAWVAAGLPVSTDVPKTKPAVFHAHVRAERVVSTSQIVANLDKQEFVVVDARSAERFRGIGETLDPVGGHIPQAANYFYQLNLDNGLFKPAETLRNEWAVVLADWPADKLVHQCGSGVTACVNLLALASAGLDGGRLYAGSWSEWCADPARPVSRD